MPDLPGDINYLCGVLYRLPQYRTLREEPCANLSLKILSTSWFKNELEMYLYILKKLPFTAYSKSSISSLLFLSTPSHRYPALITITMADITITMAGIVITMLAITITIIQLSSPSPWQPSPSQSHPLKHPGELVSCLLWLKTTLSTSFSLAHYEDYGKLSYLIMPHYVSTLPNQILILLQGFIYIFSGPLKISNFIPVRYKIHYQPGRLFAQFTKEGKGTKMQKKGGNRKKGRNF